MAVTEYIIPILYGGVAIFLIFWVFFVLYWVLNAVGILKLLKKTFQSKIPDEIYLDITEKMVNGKTFKEIFQLINKEPKAVQDQYIQAYIEVMKIQIEGGKTK